MNPASESLPRERSNRSCVSPTRVITFVRSFAVCACVGLLEGLAFSFVFFWSYVSGRDAKGRSKACSAFLCLPGCTPPWPFHVFAIWDNSEHRESHQQSAQLISKLEAINDCMVRFISGVFVSQAVRDGCLLYLFVHMYVCGGLRVPVQVACAYF